MWLFVMYILVVNAALPRDHEGNCVKMGGYAFDLCKYLEYYQLQAGLLSPVFYEHLS